MQNNQLEKKDQKDLPTIKTISKSRQHDIDLSKRLGDIEKLIVQGDLSKLSADQRVTYYNSVCSSLGLNPYTQPFAYIILKGKLTLYAKKDCTDQLREIKKVSVVSLEESFLDDIYKVKVKVKDGTGRTDIATGAVVIGHLKGEEKANVLMKAETKAKRRATLSICGLGFTDESEIYSIPNADIVNCDYKTGEIISIKPVETKIEHHQIMEIENLILKCDESFKDYIYEIIEKTYEIEDISDLNSKQFDHLKTICTYRVENIKQMSEFISKNENKIDEKQIQNLIYLEKMMTDEYVKRIYTWLLEQFQIKKLKDIPNDKYEEIKRNFVRASRLK